MLGNAAKVKGLVPFFREGIGIEGDEGVLGTCLFEGVVKGEQAREVGGVGDKGSPHLG